MNELDDVLGACQYLFNNFPMAAHVRAYAEKRISVSSQKKFCFGYFPDCENLNSLSSLVGEDKLFKLNLIYEKILPNSFPAKKEKHSSLENHNLILPYRDVYGNAIAIVGRTVLDEEFRRRLDIPKYKNTSFDKGNHLFGLYEAKESIIKNGHVYIVEGQFDCITSHDKGVTNVVALGSSNMTFTQFALLTRYTDNIFMLLDNDEAGISGREKAIKRFGNFANIKSCFLPSGYKDIDEYFVDNNSLELSIK